MPPDERQPRRSGERADGDGPYRLEAVRVDVFGFGFSSVACVFVPSLARFSSSSFPPPPTSSSLLFSPLLLGL